MELDKDDLCYGMSQEELDDIELKAVFDGTATCYVDTNHNLKIIPIEKEGKLNDYCYFCDFHELKPTLHHIIRRSDKGKNTPNNLIPLCPNHHNLIHRRIYVLGFSNGFYHLINRKTGVSIPPTERQKQKKRKLPNSSIFASDNLTTRVNEDGSRTISVKDFQRGWKKRNKKISKEVCNEQSVQSQ